MMYENIFFISGLPRSGTSLFCNIMMQNPEIFYGGNSALCQLIWDAKVSCSTNAREQLYASRKENFEKEYIESIINLYYKNVKQKFILDKCRSWTLKNNFELIQNYINPNPKIILFIRDIEEIIKSFKRIEFIPKVVSESEIFSPNTDPLMRSFYGAIYAKKYYKKNIHIVKYDDLVEKTDNVIKGVYDFLELKYFNHHYDYINDYSIENDSAYQVPNMHKIYNIIQKQNYNIDLSYDIKKMCMSLNSMLLD